MDNIETTTQAINYVLKEKTTTIKYLRRALDEKEKLIIDLRARIIELENKIENEE